MAYVRFSRTLKLARLAEVDIMLTRDEIIRDARSRAGTLPAVFVVYGILLATMALTGMAMT